MRRSTSAPTIRTQQPILSPIAASILTLAHSTTTEPPPRTPHQLPPPASTTWSPLIRWIENPLRLQALAVYTLAANIGLKRAEWHGVSMDVLRRSGEWHNLIPHPHIRPSVSYLKQIISADEIALAHSLNPRARGVEWFLLAQMCVVSDAPYARGDQLVVAAPSQIGLAMSVVPPSSCDEELNHVGRGPLVVSPTDVIFPAEEVPLAGAPWAISAVSLFTPMFQVTNPDSVMQLLVLDDPAIGANSALIGCAARRIVKDYVDSVRLGVKHGMVVSLHSLHTNDLTMLLINEMRATVPPNCDSWFTGVDRSVLHFCHDELLAWLEEHSKTKETKPIKGLVEVLRLAQSKYLQALEHKFDNAGVSEGLGVACFEEKIRLCVEHSFTRLVMRIRRRDSTNSLIHILKHRQPSSYTDLLAVVKLDDIAYDYLESIEDNSSHTLPCPAPSSSQPSSSLPLSEVTGWMSESLAAHVSQTADEMVRSEPRSSEHGMIPDMYKKMSAADMGHVSTLSNRPDKLVWLEKRRGGYWRCLFPWILLADINYELLPVSQGTGLKIREISAPHRPARVVHSFREIHDEIESRLKHDLLTVSRHNQTMPSSWLDPEVRASLLTLIAGARGLIHMGTFAPCLQHLVNALQGLLFKQRDDSLEGLSQDEEAEEIRRRTRRTFFVNYDVTKANMESIAIMFLPAEVHTFDMRPPPQESEGKKGWFGIRWHEDTLLIAPGYRKKNVLHADNSYVLLNSNTFDLKTVSAPENCGSGTESWIVGAETETVPTAFQGETPRLPRIGTPHIESGAHSLEMFWLAAERALKVKIGVLWSETGQVIPAVVLKGPLDFLSQLAAWVPGITILGNGFGPPPALQDRKERSYFSRGKFAARVWNQDQMRVILSKKSGQLHQELGIRHLDSNASATRSTYLAHAVADSVILYLHVKHNLCVQTLDGAGWTIPIPVARGNCMPVPQHVMLPKTTAVHVAGEYTLEVAVDGENKLVFKDCRILHHRYERGNVNEYRLCPIGGSS